MHLPLFLLLLTVATPALIPQGTTRGEQLFEFHDDAEATAGSSTAVKHDRDFPSRPASVGSRASCIIQPWTLPCYGHPIGENMAEKLEVQQGTLALMILKTLEVLGPLHGYGVARRIEETSKNRLTLNYGTLYPALLKLEQEGFVTAEWRPSENNRRAKFYSLTAAGRKQLAREAREWHQTADLIAAFLAPRRETP